MLAKNIDFRYSNHMLQDDSGASKDINGFGQRVLQHLAFQQTSVHQKMFCWAAKVSIHYTGLLIVSELFHRHPFAHRGCLSSCWVLLALIQHPALIVHLSAVQTLRWIFIPILWLWRSYHGTSLIASSSSPVIYWWFNVFFSPQTYACTIMTSPSYLTVSGFLGWDGCLGLPSQWHYTLSSEFTNLAATRVV